MPRLRLYQRVPVAETVRFVNRFKDREDYYEDMRRLLGRMVDDVQRFFAQDVYELSFLELDLAEGRYKVTAKGKALLKNRLNSTYSDGTEYRIQADILRRLEVRPVRAVETGILRSERMGYEAAALSRRIGDEVGIEVYTP